MVRFDTQLWSRQEMGQLRKYVLITEIIFTPNLLAVEALAALHLIILAVEE